MFATCSAMVSTHELTQNISSANDSQRGDRNPWILRRVARRRSEARRSDIAQLYHTDRREYLLVLCYWNFRIYVLPVISHRRFPHSVRGGRMMPASHRLRLRQKIRRTLCDVQCPSGANHEVRHRRQRNRTDTYALAVEIERCGCQNPRQHDAVRMREKHTAC